MLLLTSTAAAAAEATLTPAPQEQRKPWLSPETWLLVKTTQSLHPTDPNLARHYRKAKNSSQKNKAKWIVQRLQEDFHSTPKEQMCTIKMSKKGFSLAPLASATQMVNRNISKSCGN